jgi:hypothetical protein
MGIVVLLVKQVHKHTALPLTSSLVSCTSLVLQSRALVNTNHQAMKLWCQLDGCDGLLVSCYLGVICPSDQVSIELHVPVVRNRQKIGAPPTFST